MPAFQVEQIIHASSLFVMAPAMDNDKLITESASTRADWDYPRCLLEAEETLRQHQRDIPIVLLRLASVYDDNGSSPPLTCHMRRIFEMDMDSFVFPGDASHGLTYLHLDDLAACVGNTVEKRHELGRRELFLVGEPVALPHRDLIERLGELIHGETWPVISVPKSLVKASVWMKRKWNGNGLGTGNEVDLKAWMIDHADDHYPMCLHRAHERLAWAPRHRLDDKLPSLVARLRGNPRTWYRQNGFEQIAPER